MSCEEPMLALTLVFKPLPTARPEIAVCRRLRLMTMTPSSMPALMNSAATPSLAAALFFSAVIMPLRAASICVMSAPCDLLRAFYRGHNFEGRLFRVAACHYGRYQGCRCSSSCHLFCIALVYSAEADRKSTRLNSS